MAMLAAEQRIGVALLVCRQHGVKVLGRIETVIDHFYAISTERRLRHPATLAISEVASREVFGLGASMPRLRPRRP